MIETDVALLGQLRCGGVIVDDALRVIVLVSITALINVLMDLGLFAAGPLLFNVV